MTLPGRWWAVARYECRLLWRSWAFRLSALAAVGFLLLIQIVFTAPFSGAPFAFRSFSGALPLTAVRLLNLYLGLVTALLATEFVKRDRQLDSSEAVLANSFTNPGYVAGKMLGIGLAVGGLAAAALAVVAVNHRFFTDAPFAWQPYLLLPLLGTLPTLALTSGLACLLITLLRSQAVVLMLMLGLWAAAVFGGQGQFQLFDIFAFWIPLAWSDFVGFGNEEQLVRVRGAHLLAGLGCMAAAALLMGRLRQSLAANAAAAVVAAACLGGAAWMGYTYLKDRLDGREHREHLVSLSRAAASAPAASATACGIEVEHRGRELTVTAGGAVDGDQAPFRRAGHLLRVAPAASLAPGDSARVRIDYGGAPDDGAAYLDVDRERFEAGFRYWVIGVPKAYSFVTPGFLHLTPEAGWYPVSGLPPGAAFPAAGRRDYPRFRLSVEVPRGWTAFSQGRAQVDTTAGGRRFRFESGPLPGISLTAGEYERRQVEVDEVTYSLAVRPGHAYFDAHLDSLGQALPGLIRRLRADYEAALGLEYPYPRLSLVEVPLQAWSYRRLWTLAQESVQPEIVFLPEMGTLCDASDFRRLKRRSRRSQERANQAESAEDLQSGYLRTFVEVDLMGTRTLGWSPLGDTPGLRSRYHLLSNFVSFATHLSSPRWPVLNAALESWFDLGLAPAADPWSRRWGGLTGAERANLTLQERSLRELLASPEEAGETGLEAVVRAKARQLLLGFAAGAGPDRFDREMTAFLRRHRGRPASEADLLEMLEGLGAADAETRLEAWFGGTELPGYQVEGADAYLVRQGERTRTQVELTVSNPTAVDGVVEVGLRLRETDRDPWSDRGAGADHRRMVAVPAASSKRVGLVVDGPVAEMLVDTYVSRNLPALIRVPLPEARLRRGAEPFDGERVEAREAGAEDEYVVDNEDPGFEVLGVEEPNWLRRRIADLFDLEADAVPYVGFRVWSPPGTWEAATGPGFYGRFVLSGYYKRAGDGRSRVSWRTEIGEGGRYDLFYYLGSFEELRWGGRGRGQELSFLVYHQDGVESSSLEMAGAEEGWNLLGTYPLAAGPAHVELTDRGPERTVVADAVKWVRRDPPPRN